MSIGPKIGTPRHKLERRSAGQQDAAQYRKDGCDGRNAVRMMRLAAFVAVALAAEELPRYATTKSPNQPPSISYAGPKVEVDEGERFDLNIDVSDADVDEDYAGQLDVVCEGGRLDVSSKAGLRFRDVRRRRRVPRSSTIRAEGAPAISLRGAFERAGRRRNNTMHGRRPRVLRRGRAAQRHGRYSNHNQKRERRTDHRRAGDARGPRRGAFTNLHDGSGQRRAFIESPGVARRAAVGGRRRGFGTGGVGVL